MAGKQFALDPAGNPVEIQPHQAEGASNAGYRAISPEAASAHYGAQQAEERVNQKFGTVGKALAGVGSGLTLGLGPALAQHTGAISRSDLEALQESGAYQAGDIAGMIAPAFLTGGESLAAEGAIAGAEKAGGSLVGRALGMTPAGLLGRAGGAAERLAGAVLPEVGASGLGGKALQMAARGATEGALVGVSHEVADNIIQNKPFTAQAIAASGVDGALFGGLAGGVLGGFGAIAGKGVDAVGGAALSRGVGTGERSAAIALKRAGADASDLAGFTADGANLKTPLKALHDILAGEGESLASSTPAIRRAVEASEKKFIATGEDVVSNLDQGAKTMAPSLQRVEARLQSDINVKYAGEMASGEAQRALAGLQKEMAPLAGVGVPKGPFAGEVPTFQNPFQHAADMEKYNAAKAIHDAAPAILPGEGAGWKQWVNSRNHLADLASKAKEGVKGEVLRTALNAVDDEIRTSMLAAEESLGQKGLSQQYEASKVGRKLAGEMKAMVSKRVGTELVGAEPSIGARDVGTFVGMAAIGHPLSGAGFVAAKGIGKILQRRVEPQIAEAAYRMSVGAEAAGATVSVGKHIQSSLRKFMGVAGREASNEHFKATRPKFTVESLQKTIEANDQLTSSVHMAKVKDMADSLSAMGHPEMAQELVLQNQRAVEYLNWNARGVDKKAIGNGRLGKPAKPVGMDDKAYRYLRIDHAIKHPLSILDGLDNGTVGRDEVKAVKYVYPDLHAEIVSHAAQEIMAMKSQGKFLGADKIASLGLVLDEVVDSTLEKGYIDAVQQAHVANNQPQPNPQQQSSKPFVSESSAFQTPLQSSIQA